MEPGKYIASAVGHEFGESEAAGTPYVAVTFELKDSHETITWMGFFSEKTKERTLESLRYAGWDGKDFEALSGLGTTECELAIELEEYKGTARPRVRWVNSLRSGFSAKKPLSTGAKKMLAASLAGDIARINAKVKTDTDNIPF